MKRVILYSAVIMATLLGLLILWQFRLIVLLLLSAIFFAAALQPIVEWLASKGVPYAAARLLLYGVALAIFLLAALLLAEPLLDEANNAANRAIIAYDTVIRRWEEGAAWQQTAVSVLPPPFSRAGAPEADLQAILPTVINVTRSVTSVIGGFLLVLVLSVYWSADQQRIERLWLSLVPARQRSYARSSWREVETAVGSYLRSQTVQSVLAALMLGIAGGIAGIGYPILLALLGAFAAFVPIFGGLVAAAAALVTGSTVSQTTGIVLAIFTLLVFIGLELFVEPRLWWRERRSLLLTLLVIMPMYESFGLWGLIAAPFVAAALEALLVQAYRAVVGKQTISVEIDDLEKRYEVLKDKTLEAENGDVPADLNHMLDRLGVLLSDSSRYAE